MAPILALRTDGPGQGASHGLSRSPAVAAPARVDPDAVVGHGDRHWPPVRCAVTVIRGAVPGGVNLPRC
ncbi:MAG TPA: hypothetical protein VIJ23_09385 [Mycobacterium sp.]